MLSLRPRGAEIVTPTSGNNHETPREEKIQPLPYGFPTEQSFTLAQHFAMQHIFQVSCALIVGVCCSDSRAQFAAPELIAQTELAGLGLLLGGDVDGDGINDVYMVETMAIHGYYANDGNGGLGRVHYQVPVPFNVEHGALVDVDSDSDLDLVIVKFESSDPDSIFWCPNNGSGTMGSPLFIGTMTGHASSLTTADINGDGELDIAVTNMTSDVALWFENLGSGAFSPAILLTDTVDDPSCLVFGDLDGDADRDLVVGGYQDNQIACFENDGTGVFNSQVILGTMSTPVKGVAIADVDSDGVNDIIGNGGSSGVRAFHNNGTWSFTSSVQIMSAMTALAGFGVVDIDGDGDPDIWQSGYGTSSGSFFWSTNNGAGSFAPAQTVPYSLAGQGQVTFTLLKDLNGDDKPEIVAFNSLRRQGFYRLNDGVGGFATTNTFFTQNASNVVEFACGDLDNDGDIDVAAGLNYHDKLVWFENGSLGDPWLEHEVYVWTDDSNPRDLVCVDKEGNGTLDILYCMNDGFQTFSTGWFMNSGGGLFTTGPSEGSTMFGTNNLVTGDLNNDGITDHVLLDGGLHYWLGQSGGGVGAKVTISSPASTEFGAVADMDGDGDGDIVYNTSFLAPVVGIHMLVNDGVLNFNAQLVEDTVYFQEDIALADMDADGDPDILCHPGPDYNLAWLENDGGLSWVEHDLGLATAADLPLVDDFDQDGDMDLVLAIASSGVFTWYNDGAGNTESMDTIMLSTTSHMEMSLIDIDLDGVRDLVVSPDTRRIFLLIGSSNPPLGTYPLKPLGLDVHPNPSTDGILLDAASAGELIESVQIIDPNGRHVLGASFVGSAAVSLDLSRLDPGSYIMKVRMRSGKTWVARQVVQ